MMKRSLVGVALLLSLIAGAFVIAQPAQASVTSLAACTDATAVVANTHGRFYVQPCIRHLTGDPHGTYSTAVTYFCTNSAGTAVQYCNFGATQVLWYNATPMKTDPESGVGLETHEYTFLRYGSTAGCTTALIHTAVKDLKVRFTDGTLWSSSDTPTSLSIYGSQYC
jgi:hypothetical protein